MYHRIMAAHRAVMHSAPTALASTIGLAANQLHHHDTRNADSLSVPNIRTEAGRNRLCYSAVQGLNGVRREQGRVSGAAVRRHVLSELSGAR